MGRRRIGAGHGERVGPAWWAGLLVAGSLAVLAGCASGGSTAAPDPGPVGSASPNLLEAGSAVYAARCAICHGADLRGTERGPSQLSEVYKPGHHPDASYRTAIERGAPAHHFDFGDMPPVPGLSPAEVDAVIAYIRAEQVRQGFEPYRR